METILLVLACLSSVTIAAETSDDVGCQPKVIPVLHDEFHVGALYDDHTDTIQHGLSLWTAKQLQENVSIVESPHTGLKQPDIFDTIFGYRLRLQSDE